MGKLYTRAWGLALDIYFINARPWAFFYFIFVIGQRGTSGEIEKR